MQGAEAGVRLEVHLVGRLGVVRDGVMLEDKQVGSRKARTLLGVLAAQPATPRDAEWLADVLWPDDPPREPADNVATLVSRLRSALGVASIDGDRTGWHLGASVDVDVHQAARLVSSAEQRLAGEPTLALTAATTALRLLGGDVLVGEPDADWSHEVRQIALQLSHRSRLVGAEAALAVGDHVTAGRFAEEAAALAVFDETAVRLLMRASSAAGEPARGLAAYERLRRALSDELGSDPAPETRAVFLDQLAERPSPARPREGPAPTSASVPTAVIGRADELVRLQDRWARTVAGAPGLLLLCGEAGIGKTTLANELVGMVRATGGTVLQARCYETERSLLLQPLVDAIRPEILRSSPAVVRDIAGDRSASLAVLVPEIADVLGSMPHDVATPETERRLAFEAMATLLRRLAARAPVLLLLDDLHVAGLSTLDGLHFFIRRAGDARLLIAATLRTEEGQEALSRLGDLAERLDVGPLAATAVESLAETAGHRDLAESIVARTGGHALFVVETLRALREGEHGVPASLTAAVTQRVARAGAEVEELARAAAVLGASFEPETVAGLLDLTPPAAARRCEQLVAARLAIESGRAYEFANDLIHEVLYATTPEPTRHTYHRRAVDLLADWPERAAPHAAAGGQPARAATYWLAAAADASRRFALPDAERLLDLSLAAADEAGDPVLLVQARLERGRVREALTAYAGSLHDHIAGLELAREHGLLRWQMLLHREMAGDAATGMGQPLAAGIPHLEAGLDLAVRLGDRKVEAGLLARWAVLSSNRLRFVEALDLGLRAVAAGRAAEDAQALALGLDGLKTVYAYTGELGELDEVTRELEVLVRRSGDLLLLQWTVFERSFLPLAVGRWDDARAGVEEALALTRRSGRIGYESWYLGHLGWIARLEGRLDDALVHGRRSLDAPAGIHTWFRSTACAMQAANLVARGADGDHDEAVRLLRIGLESAGRSGAEAYRLRCLAPLAELTGERDLLEQADALLGAGEFAPGTAWLHGMDAYIALARAWRGHRDDVRALQVLMPLIEAGRRTGWTALLEVTGAMALAADLQASVQNSSASRVAARRAPSPGTSR
jgi:DNA-binding SARP family transcriptional activator/ABC-type oligopeptide transport system ATPase subunit